MRKSGEAKSFHSAKCPRGTHFIARIGWLRVALLGANEGFLLTASLVVGVAAASAATSAVVIASLTRIRCVVSEAVAYRPHPVRHHPDRPPSGKEFAVKSVTAELALAPGLIISSLSLSACHYDHPRSAGSHRLRDGDHRDLRD
jgi:hypothetical protein